MKNTSIHLFALSLLALLSCQESTNKKLDSLDILRGELLLCGTEQFGDVSFSLDCHYDSRETFDLALSLLHSFEYKEAEKAFVKVADMDPECAMAYWGIAMSSYHSLWGPPSIEVLEKGSKLIEIAQSLNKTETAQDYINAAEVIYTNWDSLSHTAREALYADKMKELYMKNTDDNEAAVFYALSLISTANPMDTTYANQKKAGALLEKLFKKNPNHPGIAHYIIHAYDYPKIAHLALESARRYAEIAPSSSHAQHMPSHIFTRLGLWEEAINSDLNSASSAVCYQENNDPDLHTLYEIHAIAYLVYANLQIGNNKIANEQYEHIKTFKRTDINDGTTYPVAAIPSRIALENKDWAKASKLQFLSNFDFPWQDFPWQKAIIHFSRSLGFSNLGDIESASIELDSLKSLREDLLILNSNLGDYKAQQVNIQIHSADAWIHLAKRENIKALKLMKLAAKMENETSKHPVTPGEILPADELLGDMLLTLNKSEEALRIYENGLNTHPNRFNGIYGAASAARDSGNKEKAILYFNQLIELCKNSNSDRPELIDAKLFVASNPT
jgi:hypothetical protein